MTTAGHPRRGRFTLAGAAREFCDASVTVDDRRHAGEPRWRRSIVLGDWQITDALVPAVMLAVFPFLEWVIHVCILHWRPRRVGGVTVDPLLARKHREHHVDPRDIPLIFIPWQSLLWVLPLAVGVALLVFPRPGLGLTFLAFADGARPGLRVDPLSDPQRLQAEDPCLPGGLAQPPAAPLQERALLVHRHQSGTADRVLRTYPDPATIASSPTARRLHGDAGLITPGR